MFISNPLPQTLKEAVWQGLVAILLATRVKDIWLFSKRVWVSIRESGATAKVRSAEADKISAEAEEIRAHTEIDTATLIREMSISMGQAKLLEEQLRDKLASQASIIELLRAENADLKKAQLEEDEQQSLGG